MSETIMISSETINTGTSLNFNFDSNSLRSDIQIQAEVDGNSQLILQVDISFMSDRLSNANQHSSIMKFDNNEVSNINNNISVINTNNSYNVANIEINSFVKIQQFDR